MKIFIGSDHAGFDLKGELVAFLRGLGYEWRIVERISSIPSMITLI
jgi:ribose 5-phosphate isomerase RpiB